MKKVSSLDYYSKDTKFRKFLTKFFWVWGIETCFWYPKEPKGPEIQRKDGDEGSEGEFQTKGCHHSVKLKGLFIVG